ncbi:hypothetical protein CTEN210_00295 [Chaetoceros tenuissimus]|uniref:Leucine-rich repeat domain-containing protein n=1 Tax=Chaetoceros tenuissimus TaxID=426638 RepID=A0AAD3CCY3_9STRA|nr:hypothetical protein CTEN210_00295 [Chaetoceros tenuissimus]
MRVGLVDGLVTLFYDGSKKLFNEELETEWYHAVGNYWDRDDIQSLNLSEELKKYMKERFSWQQVIVVDGVTEIQKWTFSKCKNIKRVIFADTVIRIESSAFGYCKDLAFINLPKSLEFIGNSAFSNCNLSSVFIPPRCREIRDWAFYENKNLTILNIPQNTELGNNIFVSTKLLQSYPVSINNTTWLKNINNHDQFALHRVCSSFEPTLQMILQTMLEKGGPKAFKEENNIGITPSRYLKENPYASVSEKDIIENYIMHMMGER